VDFDFFEAFQMTLAIALLTVSYQTLKAARTDPIITLKYE